MAIFSSLQFNQSKIVFHHDSMQAYWQKLLEDDKTVIYIDSQDEKSDITKLISELIKQGCDSLHILDVLDDWLLTRIKTACQTHNIELTIDNSPAWLNLMSVYESYFNKYQNKGYFHHDFYKLERIRENILVDDNKPIGGQWSFDSENRKKFPKTAIPPSIHFPSHINFVDDAIGYTKRFFANHYGEIAKFPQPNELSSFYPVTHEQAEIWLDEFLTQRFKQFGDYEDAIVAKENMLYHSVFSPLMNVGLLTPNQILTAVLENTERLYIPLNSLEGFIRQLIGWREFIAGLYQHVGRRQRTSNFWGFNHPMPRAFYTATTGILPVDTTIQKVLTTGYCHHIERLMILSNFMLLCEIHPDAVYKWFMELFIDAYDWVMVPNIYGMSQFSDGGLMATKTYISGSNYLGKMSDYTTKSKGQPLEWAMV